MRKLLFAASIILLLPAVAAAQGPVAPIHPPAAVPETPSLSERAPQPRPQGGMDGYHVAAISAGAVAGVVVANIVTGGLITPVLMAGVGGGGLMGHGIGWMAVNTGVTATGAFAGGYAGDWLYRN